MRGAKTDTTGVAPPGGEEQWLSAVQAAKAAGQPVPLHIARAYPGMTHDQIIAALRAGVQQKEADKRAEHQAIRDAGVAAARAGSAEDPYPKPIIDYKTGIMHSVTKGDVRQIPKGELIIPDTKLAEGLYSARSHIGNTLPLVGALGISGNQAANTFANWWKNFTNTNPETTQLIQSAGPLSPIAASRAFGGGVARQQLAKQLSSAFPEKGDTQTTALLKLAWMNQVLLENARDQGLGGADGKGGLVRVYQEQQDKIKAAMDRLESGGKTGASTAAAKPKGDPATRFGDLMKQGKSKEEAYGIMHQEGY